MCTSVSPLYLFLPYKPRFLHRRSTIPVLNSSLPLFPLFSDTRPRNPRLFLSASVTQQNLEFSWVSPDQGGDENYNGWAIVESAIKKKRKGLSKFILVGIGTSIVAALAAVAHFSLARKGFVFSSPFHVPGESKPLSSDAALADDVVSEVQSEIVSDELNETVELETNHIKKEEGKPGRVIISISVDSTQQEALMLLKKLKIIEDGIKADELCTKREYARWLVLVNSQMERNPRHRIVPSVALSGSRVAAFDDVSVEDPDFESIQPLAEAGIVLSKLSDINQNSDFDNPKGLEAANFFPDRFISRQDLISWKANLEYKVMPGISEEISRNIIGFMDAREIRSDALVGLFMDRLADEKSIMRKVFGQGKRFQPSKPCTKAQAAVALTSGRMTEAIIAEISKIEAENSSRQSAMEEIRSELLERGDIQRVWEKKLEEEKIHGLEVERAYVAAISYLEQEKIVQENALAAYLKEEAALDCQKQLLSSLKEEVDEMSTRLVRERAEYVEEQLNIQNMLSEFEVKHEGVLDAKSILEAEVEAVRILRSWVEDEARKGQARTKVLEEVGRRWKWENPSGGQVS